MTELTTPRLHEHQILIVQKLIMRDEVKNTCNRFEQSSVGRDPQTRAVSQQKSSVPSGTQPTLFGNPLIACYVQVFSSKANTTS
jgi:hypothetical protein